MKNFEIIFQKFAFFYYINKSKILTLKILKRVRFSFVFHVRFVMHYE